MSVVHFFQPAALSGHQSALSHRWCLDRSYSYWLSHLLCLRLSGRGRPLRRSLLGHWETHLLLDPWRRCARRTAVIHSTVGIFHKECHASPGVRTFPSAPSWLALGAGIDSFAIGQGMSSATEGNAGVAGGGGGWGLPSLGVVSRCCASSLTLLSSIAS